MISDSSEMCWVYAVESKGCPLSIGIAINMLLQVKEIGLLFKERGYRLIYCKQFPDTISALGHKLLLEHISPQSVMCIIKEENPDLNDLRNTITN